MLLKVLLFHLKIWLCFSQKLSDCQEFLHIGVCLKTGYNKLVLPAKPVSVSLTFQILNLPRIDNEQRTLTLTLLIWRKWQDLRIHTNFTFGPRNPRLPMPKNALKKIWMPDIFFRFLDKYEEPLPDTSETSTLDGWYLVPNGYVSHFMTSHITTRCKMDFSAFPMDRQECIFKVGSPNLDMTHIIFDSFHTVDDLFVKAAKEYQHINITDSGPNVAVFPDGNFSVTGLKFVFKRPLLPFILEFYLPCGGMVTLSWISFIISPSAIPGRTTLLVTLFLVLTGYFGSIQAETPKSPDLSALALYALTCQAFVFFASLEFAFLLLIERMRRSTFESSPPSNIFFIEEARPSWGRLPNNSSQNGKPRFTDYAKFSNHVDKNALFIFLIVFVIFNFWYFLTF